MNTKVVITDVYDLKNNYGVQGLVLPLVDKISDIIDAEFIMPVQAAYYTTENIKFAHQNGIRLVCYWKYSFLFELFYPLVKSPESFFSRLFVRLSRKRKHSPVSLFHELVKEIKNSDIVIDVAGIEFIGNSGFKKKWGELFFSRMFQKVSKRFGKPYFKYTKSYGPLEGPVFSRISKNLLEELPFVFVRGRKNLEELERFNFKTPLYLFPDVSLVLKPSDKKQIKHHLKVAGIDTSYPVIGISPSRVLSKINSPNYNNCVGLNHIEIIKELIIDFSRNYQVLIIPHAIDRVDKGKCDREFAMELLRDIRIKGHVSIIPEGMSYSDVRAVIGYLTFYITGRYHSVASALYMGTPVVSLAWHIKYADIMGEFLDDYLTIDCRNTTVDDALKLIRKYHEDLRWFDLDKIDENRKRIGLEVEKSVSMLMEYAGRLPKL